MNRLQPAAIISGACLLITACNTTVSKEDKPLNILILTLDDMGYGTTGVEGCTVPDITPTIDKLASEGMLFTYGFVMSPICGPSRSAMLSGRYPHCNGVMGHGQQPPPFWQQPEVVTPTITQYLHDHGYITGSILKNSREINNVWDVKYQELPLGVGYHDRNPESFYQRTRAFISDAKKMGKPFFLYANPIDPHDPWVETELEKKVLEQWNPERPYPLPSRRYKPEEIEVPVFLPDMPAIREKLLPYYESLHRGDECLGSILKALDESGEAENTIIFFMSDNGMGAPGGKTSLYHHGIRTPMIVRWPGKVKAGVVDEKSIVSSIDFVPTILDAIGKPPLEGIEGISFIDVLTGKVKQSIREYSYAATTYFNDSKPGQFIPHRAIIDRDYCYIWNSYVERFHGEKKFPRNFHDIVEKVLDGRSPEFSKKIESIVDKSVEELFDLTRDPGCWNNLAGSPDHEKILLKYRERLLHEMTVTADPELPFFNMGK